MEKGTLTTINRWMWWPKGNCVVEIVRRGNYPDTVLVNLPNNVQTQIELHELEQRK